MKTLLLILSVMISIQSCEDIQFIEGTSQAWTGGITGTPGGVNYTLSLIALRNSSELNVDQLWVKDEFYRVHAVKKLPARIADGFVENDTLYIRATKVNDQVGVNKEKSKPRPEDMDEEWVIGYEINGKRRYLGTNDLKLLKAVSNP